MSLNQAARRGPLGSRSFGQADDAYNLLPRIASITSLDDVVDNDVMLER